MEMIHRPGDALTCTDVRETLSDLIDAREGEIPYPGGTRLAEPGMRSAVELHLASCAGCREELHALEEVGAAFAEFSVEEAPVQRFAEYARLVRARLAREGALAPGARGHVVSRRRGLWITLAASGLAASLTFFVSAHYFHNKVSTPAKVVAAHNVPSIDPGKFTLPVSLRVQHQIGDAQFATEDFEYNPHAPSRGKQLEDEVDQNKYAIVMERPAMGEQPLLGAYIKTTRDVEHTDDGTGVGGLVVYGVTDGSPAQKMGLRKGDHIVDINNMAVKDSGPTEMFNFFSGIHHLGKGQSVTLQVVRPMGSQWLYVRPLTGVLGDYEQ